jgi:hypothetical protein
LKFVFQGVTTENVVKGKSRYTKAVVDYTYNGEPRKQTMMSFSNPGVLKQVQELTPGQEIEVEVGKNDAGFNEWKSINVSGAVQESGSKSATPVGAATTRVAGSNYETAVERANRQVLIVKQSSLSAAVATLAPGAKAALDPDEVIALADRYKEYVFNSDEEDIG